MVIIDKVVAVGIKPGGDELGEIGDYSGDEDNGYKAAIQVLS